MMSRLIKKNSLSLIAIPFLFVAKVSLATTCPTLQQIVGPDGNWATSFPDGFIIKRENGQPPPHFYFSATINRTSSQEIAGKIICYYHPATSSNEPASFLRLEQASAWAQPEGPWTRQGVGFFCNVNLGSCAFNLSVK